MRFVDKDMNLSGSSFIVNGKESADYGTYLWFWGLTILEDIFNAES